MDRLLRARLWSAEQFKGDGFRVIVCVRGFRFGTDSSVWKLFVYYYLAFNPVCSGKLLFHWGSVNFFKENFLRLMIPSHILVVHCCPYVVKKCLLLCAPTVEQAWNTAELHSTFPFPFVLKAKTHWGRVACVKTATPIIYYPQSHMPGLMDALPHDTSHRCPVSSLADNISKAENTPALLWRVIWCMSSAAPSTKRMCHRVMRQQKTTQSNRRPHSHNYFY